MGLMLVLMERSNGFLPTRDGTLRVQDALSDGSMWAESYLSQSSTASFETLLPVSGVTSFSYAINSPAGDLQGTSVTISVGGTSVALMNFFQGLKSISIITRC